MLFDTLDLAPAWLAVKLASRPDTNRPALSDTVNVEVHPNGVRLVATDGIVLLTAWVPHADAGGWDDEPGVDEPPDGSVVAADPHGRAAGLLAHVLKLARGNDDQLFNVRLEVGAVEPDRGDAGLVPLAGLEQRWVTLELPGVERVKLREVEAGYPDWRKLLAGRQLRPTDRLAFDPAVIGRLAKLGKLFGGPLHWRFGGEGKPAGVSIGDGERIQVTGLVMPCRWDLDLNAPAADIDKAHHRCAESGGHDD